LHDVEYVLRKWLLEPGEKELGIKRRLEIDPRGDQCPAWPLEPVDKKKKMVFCCCHQTES